jgi:hypothetical protein
MPPFSVNWNLGTLNDEERAHFDDRLLELVNEASRQGIELREDSRLVYHFCARQPISPYATPRAIVHEMKCVDLFHKMSEYGAVVEGESKVFARSLVERGVPWGDAWRITRDHFFDMMKYKHVLGVVALF